MMAMGPKVSTALEEFSVLVTDTPSQVSGVVADGRIAPEQGRKVERWAGGLVGCHARYQSRGVRGLDGSAESGSVASEKGVGIVIPFCTETALNGTEKVC
jgi:hypothetical protein